MADTPDLQKQEDSLLMNISTDKEYRVLVTQTPVSEPNGQPGRWRATVLGFPYIAEEAVSREQVIQQIQARLADSINFGSSKPVGFVRCSV